MSLHKIQNKFRGCLLGSLMGDCLGAPYEGMDVSSGDRIIIQRYFDKMENPEFKAPFKKYTDDTAMMKSVAKFLIDKPEPDLKHLAKLFVAGYFQEPRRGYGEGVVEVFRKLKNSKFDDIYRPSKEQFSGSGSYGNGGAMRIAPIALYFYDKYECMLDTAIQATKITHSNMIGINGALLQCLAIQQALLIDSESSINTDEFCSSLLKKMENIENSVLEDCEETIYCEKIRRIQTLLGKQYSDDLDDEVIFTLGNGIGAHESVPTAIYCFLRAQSSIPKVETTNVIRRTIQYAITLGGDTDTIACMAGAIAGAHIGYDVINKDILNHCEKYQDIITLADSLYESRQKD